jgi:hypothetical protein
MLRQITYTEASQDSRTAGELAGRFDQYSTAWFGVRLQAFVGILTLFTQKPTLFITWSEKQDSKPTDSSLWTILKVIHS